MTDRLEVVLIRPEREEALLSSIHSLRSDLADRLSEIGVLQKEVAALQNRLLFEAHANDELIDILRAHSIPFRPALERSKASVK